ncbi:MAG: hypothetical protein B7Y56_02465 [Gallionellales bacterium 35-53-114]|jgi:hypothetical protein|nr:MAG: hypothetical protein B7Y56_02465 [Gallionellales bacterium 35-53-114]OYZ64481.1 MAG: hypothetical protein B7Y04_06245 [Gallionellales bacterium 24-53-125]OZB10215.1 MAG: hypothetical protein B7X61_01465 [Gallionellales bacterium 39-52-133]HQS56804.1 hypothetical protein [Gallionellaceae bacterium]HQS75412.1 hypothetical protein [Gallionellaceae bacterium]
MRDLLRKLFGRAKSIESEPRSSAKDYYRRAIWYPLIGLFVVMFIPESFVSDSLILKKLIGQAGYWIPAINNLSAVSDFPYLSGLYMTVMWALLPLSVLWWLVYLPMSAPSRSIDSIWWLLGAFAMLILFLALLATLIYWFPYHPYEKAKSLSTGRSGIFLGLISYYRLGPGLFLGAVFYIFSFASMISLRVVWLSLQKLVHIFPILFKFLTMR